MKKTLYIMIHDLCVEYCDTNLEDLLRDKIPIINDKRTEMYLNIIEYRFGEGFADSDANHYTPYEKKLPRDKPLECPECKRDNLIISTDNNYKCTYCEHGTFSVQCENCYTTLAESGAYVIDLSDNDAPNYYCDEDCYQQHIDKFQE